MLCFIANNTIIERLLRVKQSSGRREQFRVTALLTGTLRPGPARNKGRRPTCTRKGGLINEKRKTIQALARTRVKERLGDTEQGEQTPRTPWGTLVLLGANGRPQLTLS